MKRALLVVTIACVAACAHRDPGSLRFAVQPPIWRVDDHRPLDHRPEMRNYNRTLYQLDGFFLRRLTRAMELPSTGRALDVNSIDEVPDSTWFTNRIGIRELSIDEVRRGPNEHASPFEHLPWKIVSSKIGGTSLGFVIKDSAGDKYLLKFDEAALPEMETAAHIIGHRILWACGYNVPEDHLGYVRREDIELGPDAMIKDAFGGSAKLSVEQVDHALTTTYRTDDGRYRVLVSRFLPGVPVGPYAREGTRDDDPNDRIPHERRRSVRGEQPLFAWLNHTDIQEDNTLDAFILEPGSKDRGHLVHYLIDFGKALGVMGTVNHWRTVGYTYRVDFAIGLKTLVSLGLWPRPWEQVASPSLRGVGLFEAEHFDPARWQINSPYWPFDDQDRFDGFWGAKIAIQFTAAQLTAIVDEAKFSDPHAAHYMVDTLIERQRRVARYWFRQVSPLDHFTVEATGDHARLCFDDLALVHGLERDLGRYQIEVYDHGGRALAPARVLTSRDGHACVDDVPLGTGDDRYTIVRLAAQRDDETLPTVRVHVARDSAQQLLVIGLRRD